MKIILFLTGLLLTHSVSTAAQSAPSPSSVNSQNPQPSVQQSVREGGGGEKQREFNRVKDFDRQRISNRQGTVGFIRRRSLPFKVSLNKEQKMRLAPDAYLASSHAAFLKEPRTGLFKLYPDAGCEPGANVLRADGGCPDWIPNSAFYSFREKEHTSEFLSDILYRNGFLVTDGMLSQGILAAVGDVPLENVSSGSGAAKFLLEYKPEPLLKDAYNQFLQISRGVKNGDFEYRKAVRAAENMTYMLRVTAYKGSFYSSYRGWVFDIFNGDNRVDLTLAFRILRKEEDGVVTILWKELARQKSPRLIFPKREKKKDFRRQSYAD